MFYKFVAIFLLIFSTQAFSSDTPHYNNKNELENYTRSEVRILIENIDRHIFNYCRELNYNFRVCFETTKNKLIQIYSENFNIHPYDQFLRDCQNQILSNQTLYNFGDFFRCFENYQHNNNLITVKPDINYVFLLEDYAEDLKTKYCRYQTSEVNVIQGNQCLQQQTEGFQQISLMWFDSATNVSFKQSIEKCIDDYMVINNNDLIIDFYKLKNCL